MLEKIRAQKTLITVLCLAVSLAVTVVAGMDFYSFRNYQEVIIPGEGVTDSFMLSEYLPALKGTYGDTTVYVLEGEKEGASMLVLGGTHPNEPAGHMAAVSLVEHCTVDSGTLYVIPGPTTAPSPTTTPRRPPPTSTTSRRPAAPGNLCLAPAPPTPWTSGPTRTSTPTSPPARASPEARRET